MTAFYINIIYVPLYKIYLKKAINCEWCVMHSIYYLHKNVYKT